jgi:amino acid permease
VAALITSSLFALLAFMGVHAGSGKVFNWFANMTSVAGLMTWFGISFTYIRFYAGMKVQGIDRKTLPFSSPLQPYAAWYAAIGCLVICLVRIPHLLLYAFIRPESKEEEKRSHDINKCFFCPHSSAAGLCSSGAIGSRPILSRITFPS